MGLSGGHGTVRRIMEVVSWRMLGVHDCGVVLYNVEGFWDRNFEMDEKSY